MSVLPFSNKQVTEKPKKRQLGCFHHVIDELKTTGSSVRLYRNFLHYTEAWMWMKVLSEKAGWAQENINMFGKKVLVPRKMAYYGTASYSFSGVKHTAAGWPDWILPLKQLVEEALATQFNYVLLNYYANGDNYIGYHSDDEKDLVEGSVIASLSFGAHRIFNLKKKEPKEKAGITKKTRATVISVDLYSGSLLTMEGNTQKHYQHQVPKTKKCTQPRINATFRVMKESSK